MPRNLQPAAQGQHLGGGVTARRGAIGDLFQEQQGLEGIPRVVSMLGPRFDRRANALASAQGLGVKLLARGCRNARKDDLTQEWM
ncbi:MAG: hypothetical protein WDO74_03785 [Pseudomonadota bacterium]